MADVRIGEPRRHRARGDQSRHLTGMTRNLFVSFERRGADALRAMARLAMLLKDGQNVAIENGMRRLRQRMNRALLRAEICAQCERGTESKRNAGRDKYKRGCARLAGASCHTVCNKRVIRVIGCGKIIRRCAHLRKWRGGEIAMPHVTVYDDCDNEKAMEFA